MLHRPLYCGIFTFSRRIKNRFMSFKIRFLSNKKWCSVTLKNVMSGLIIREFGVAATPNF